MRLHISIKQIKEILFVFVLIFSSDTFLTFANESRFPKLLFRILMCLCIFYFLTKRSHFLNRTKITLTGILCFLIFVTIVVNNDYSGGNFIKIFVLIFGYFFSEYIDFRCFKKIYINILSFIAGYSLICYILYPLLVKLDFFPVISNGSKSVLCLFLCNIDLSPDSLIRNWGPFWEPGVFQVYLILALMLLLSEKEKEIKKIIIICIAIATTFSTTGFVSLILVFLGYYCGTHNKLDTRIVFLGLIGIIGVIILLTNNKFYELILGKFNPKSALYASTSSRFGSIVANWLCIKENWFCGVGVTNLNLIVNRYQESKGYYFFSNTNGLLMNFSIFGCFFGIIYLILIYHVIKEISHHSLVKTFFFLLAILFELFSEPLVNSLLMNTIIFYAFRDMRRNHEDC